MPGCMFEGIINMSPGSRVVHQDHEADGGAAEYVEGVETVHVANIQLTSNEIRIQSTTEDTEDTAACGRTRFRYLLIHLSKNYSFDSFLETGYIEINQVTQSSI